MAKLILRAILMIFIIGTCIYIGYAIDLGIKIKIIDEYPAIAVGVVAAIFALFGVVISQAVQSYNTNKNIEANNLNLNKQLNSQREALETQLSSQQEALNKQLQHAVDLQKQEIDSEKQKYLYEYHKEAQKEMFLNLYTLYSLIGKHISSCYKLQLDNIQYGWYSFLCNQEATSTDENKKNRDNFESDRQNSMKKYSEVSIELNKIRSVLNFHHEINGIAKKEHYRTFITDHDKVLRELIGIEAIGINFIEKSQKGSIEEKDKEIALKNLDKKRDEIFDFRTDELSIETFYNLLNSIKD